jgi:ABC-type dipeptide/oligopeptide/nickel transport system ATPase subunit
MAHSHPGPLLVFPERSGKTSLETTTAFVRERAGSKSSRLPIANVCIEIDCPNGIETVLSEGGLSISSGERQLISIARAFARDPELIIFDEATSYIDSNTEAQIQDAMANLMKNRTSIVVAHPLEHRPQCRPNRRNQPGSNYRIGHP